MTIAELRRARMARGLSLTEISRRTRIGVGYLRKIDDGDLQGLPAGFYARAFVRAYADAVGLDGELVVSRLADRRVHAGATGTPRGPRRFLAAWVDGLLLSSIYVSVLALTALTCGISIVELVEISGLEVFTVLAIITLMYVLLMGGIAGRTIGAMLLDVPLTERPRRPLDLHAIARRSLDCVRADFVAAGELSAIVEHIFGRARRAA
jgi:Helix-turn-helix domain/RDD family